MGKIKNNAATSGFSGKLGNDITFRQVDGKTIFAKRTLSSAAPSEKQLQVRSRFSEATQFASAAIDNPQALLEYSALASILDVKSAYLAAVIDYLTPPEIGAVFVANYKGHVGDEINITPDIPVKLTQVTVSIHNADGTVLEAGDAVPRKLKWTYVAKAVNAQLKGSKLVVVGRDRQDRETTFEKIL